MGQHSTSGLLLPRQRLWDICGTAAADAGVDVGFMFCRLDIAGLMARSREEGREDEDGGVWAELEDVGDGGDDGTVSKSQMDDGGQHQQQQQRPVTSPGTQEKAAATTATLSSGPTKYRR
ncbi:hypothetical protein HK405_001672, partial [Cladochytrium tenue]